MADTGDCAPRDLHFPILVFIYSAGASLGPLKKHFKNSLIFLTTPTPNRTPIAAVRTAGPRARQRGDEDGTKLKETKQ